MFLEANRRQNPGEAEGQESCKDPEQIPAEDYNGI